MTCRLDEDPGDNSATVAAPTAAAAENLARALVIPAPFLFCATGLLPSGPARCRHHVADSYWAPGKAISAARRGLPVGALASPFLTAAMSSSFGYCPSSQ